MADTDDQYLTSTAGAKFRIFREDPDQWTVDLYRPSPTGNPDEVRYSEPVISFDTHAEAVAAVDQVLAVMNMPPSILGFVQALAGSIRAA